MDTSHLARVSALVDDDSIASALEPAMRGELALVLARALLSADALDEAEVRLQHAASDLGPASHPALAAEWLRMARAWSKRTEPVDVETRVEGALRRAAALDPAQGRVALARYLQRSDRLDDAAAEWARVVSESPQDTTAALSLARIYEKKGEIASAADVYLHLIEVAPTARNYLTAAQRLDELDGRLPEVGDGAQIRVALVGNATLDYLAAYVKVECYRAGLRPKVFQGGFDQYTQEMLDPTSALYAFAPDVLVCAIHASRLFPTIHHDPSALSADQRRAEIQDGLQTVDRLLAAFTQRSEALVLLHNMVAPQYPALGILDWREEIGQAELFGEINRGLAELIRTRYRAAYIVDEDRVQARAGKAQATDTRQWLTARMPWTESVLLGLSREYMRYIKPVRSLTRKCIVLDLDNTLWGGVIGEDGMEGIQLSADAPGNAFVAFQRELDRLWRRGILLAVCSKNNPDDVQPVLETHPFMVLRSTHLAAQRINWLSKAANIRELATELNIGLDSLVFIDDNPVERAAVRAELPQVLVPEWPTDPAHYRAALLALDVFESLALTEEDRNRAKLYAEQRLRREFQSSVETGSLDSHLAGLQMVVRIAPATSATLPRIAQLTNKTNQFNLTTRRYTEVELTALQERGYDIFGMQVSDRFGDNGLVGVAILGPLEDGAREIDSFLLSCRVMGRQVESALLEFLAECARSRGASNLRGRFIPTSKNAPARDCYERHGFVKVEEAADGSSLWATPVAQAPRAPEWLTVVTPELVDERMVRPALA